MSNVEIASASEEQASGIAQIGKAMNQLDEITQQNAAASEEAAASADQLSSQSESLIGNVLVLNKIVSGASVGRDSNAKLASLPLEVGSQVEKKSFRAA